MSLDQILLLLASVRSGFLSLSLSLLSRFISTAHLSLEVSLQRNEGNYSLKRFVPFTS